MPQPWGQKVTLHYTIPTSGPVVITVFDFKGDIVDILQRGRQEEGDYSTTWDGKNRGGRNVARGVYFIKVVAPGIDEIRKVLVVR
ncbi:MAG: FlgD immunoglobulin-like domain containing protein [Arenicellales bacterium]|nr:FlgD immunoglobulin-like domain containing protein [Arenicellales bacterium]